MWALDHTVSAPWSSLFLCPFQVSAPAVHQAVCLTRWSTSSRRPWPLHLSSSERWAKLASPAPSLPTALDPDPDPDPDPNQGRTHEEQYVSEGEGSHLDADQLVPDCRDAETITGAFVHVCVFMFWNIGGEGFHINVKSSPEIIIMQIQM